MKMKGTNITKSTELEPNESVLNKISFSKFRYQLSSATNFPSKNVQSPDAECNLSVLDLTSSQRGGWKNGHLKFRQNGLQTLFYQLLKKTI